MNILKIYKEPYEEQKRKMEKHTHKNFNQATKKDNKVKKGGWKQAMLENP